MEKTMNGELTDEEILGTGTKGELSDADVLRGTQPVAKSGELSDQDVMAQPIDAEALGQKQAQYEAENPFFTRIGQRLEKGVFNVAGSYHAVRAANEAQRLNDLMAGSGNPLNYLPGATEEEKQKAIEMARGNLRESLTSLIGNRADVARIPTAPVMEATQGQSLANALRAISVDPLAWVAEAGLSSAPGSAVAMAPAVIGARRGGAKGGMGGAFVGSAITDYAGELAGELAQLGIDPKNPEAVSAALSDPNVVESIKVRSGQHAVPVALLDALSFGIAGKTVAPAALKPLAREAINIPAQVGIQGVMGGTGEALGQFARDGGITDWGDVLAEIGGEAFGAPVEVGTAAISGMRGNHAEPTDTIPPTPTQLGQRQQIVSAVEEAVNAQQQDIMNRSGLNDAAKQASSKLMGEINSLTYPEEPAGIKNSPEKDAFMQLEFDKWRKTADDLWLRTEQLAPTGAKPPAPDMSYKTALAAYKSYFGLMKGHLTDIGEKGLFNTLDNRTYSNNTFSADTFTTNDVKEGTPLYSGDLAAPGGQGAFLSKNTVPGQGPWRVTVFDKAGIDGPHIHYPDYNSAVEGLKRIASDPVYADVHKNRISVYTPQETLRSAIGDTERPSYNTAFMDALFGRTFEQEPHRYFKPSLATMGEQTQDFWKANSRPITSATNPELVGRSLTQAMPKPGEVAIAGFDQLKLNEPETLRNMQEYVSKIGKIFAPNKAILVTDGTGEDVLAHVKQNDINSVGAHLFKLNPDTWVVTIFPRNVPEEGSLSYATLLQHELGHMIALEKLYESPPAIRTAVAQEYVDYVKKSLDRPLMESIREQFGAVHTKWIESYLSKRYPSFYEQYFNTKSLREFMRETRLIRPEALEDMLHYWMDADEWIANQHVKYSEHPKLGGTLAERFFTRSAALVKALQERYGITKPTQSYISFLKRERFTSAKNAIIGNTAGRQIAEGLQRMESKGLSPPSGGANAVVQNPWATAGEIDHFNKMMEQTYSVWQIAEVNKHIVGLQTFTAELEAMAQTKNKVLHNAEQRLIEMSNLGKERLGNVTELLLDETVDGQFYSLNDPKIVQKYNLDAEMIDVINNIKADFAEALNTLERILTGDIIQRLSHDPALMQAEVNKLHKQMQDMRSKPYFPLARFGNYTAVVRAKADIIIDGKIYKKGSVVEMRTYESKSEQDKGAKELGQDYAQHNVSLGKDYLEDVVFEFRGVPPQIFDSLKDQLKLSKRQEEQLDQYRIAVAPGRSFLKHLKKRNKTMGFSEDGERAYASYMSRMSNHLSRLQHYKKLSASLASVADDATRIQMAGTTGNITDATKRRKIHQYMAETYDYIMNPQNEWTGIRSLAFMFHLGLNVKSALVNLTQLPLATYPQLATEFGDVNAVRAMSDAMRDVVDLWRRPARVPLEVREAVEWGVDAGILDQSFASMVAGVAEGHLLSRALPGAQGARAMKQASHVASFMFSEAEKFNRRISFISAYKLARQKGINVDEARQLAKRMTRNSQVDYAKWAKPKMFRGKKGAFLVFKMYQLHMLHLFFRDKARLRMWLMFGMMAGAMGLPFGEDLADLIDWTFSHGNEKFDSRAWISEHMKNMHLKPDLIMHGISRQTFGLAALMSYIGVPFPKFDFSGSIGMGRVIPGMEMLQPSAQNWNERLGQMTTQALGAGFAIPLAMAQTIANWDMQPNTWKKIEQMLPDALRNVSKAIRYGTDGGFTDAKGAKKVRLSWQDNEQRMEIIGQALGFNPTEIARKQEQDRILRAHTKFYTLRQQKLLQDFGYARVNGDREAIADVRRAIKEYNQEVPDSRLRISGTMLAKSVHSRLRAVMKTERGLPAQGNKFRGLQKDLEKIFQDDADLTDIFTNSTSPD